MGCCASNPDQTNVNTPVNLAVLRPVAGLESFRIKSIMPEDEDGDFDFKTGEKATTSANPPPEETPQANTPSGTEEALEPKLIVDDSEEMTQIKVIDDEAIAQSLPTADKDD